VLRRFVGPSELIVRPWRASFARWRSAQFQVFIAKGLGPTLEESARQIVCIVGAVHDDAPDRIVAALWIVIARRQLTRSPFRTNFWITKNLSGIPRWRSMTL
jgi:hypothetical protein